MFDFSFKILLRLISYSFSSSFSFSFSLTLLLVAGPGVVVVVVDLSLCELAAEIIFAPVVRVKDSLAHAAQYLSDCIPVNFRPVAFDGQWVCGVTSETEEGKCG